MTGRIVVVGGYGHVGRHLLRALGDGVPVVVAGRRVEAAARVAGEQGLTACPTPVDALDGTGLDAAAGPGDLVVNATGDDPGAGLLRAAIDRRCDYADLTADPASIAALLDLDARARAAGVTALAGIGLAPGATNVLARAAVEHRPGASHVDVGLLLSAIDGFGPAAVDWTLSTAATTLHVERPGRGATTVVPFGARTRLPLAGRERTAFSFGFPEQVFLPESLGVTSAAGWLALHPAPIGRALALVARPARTRRWLGRPGVRRRAVRLATALPRHGRGGVVAAIAVARDGASSAHASLVARGESPTTAACAAAILDVADRSAPGVHLPERVVEPDALFAALARRGIPVTTSRSPAPLRSAATGAAAGEPPRWPPRGEGRPRRG